MKIIEGFKLRDICGAFVVIGEGEAHIDFSKVISLNESAACVWKAVQDKEFSLEDMTYALMSEYEIDQETALKDCKILVEQWKDAGVLA